MAKRRRRKQEDELDFDFTGGLNDMLDDLLGHVFSGQAGSQQQQQLPKPEYGIPFKNPRNIVELCQLLQAIGFQVMYPQDEAATHIAELHGISVLATTTRGETKQVFIAFTGFQKRQ